MTPHLCSKQRLGLYAEIGTIRCGTAKKEHKVDAIGKVKDPAQRSLYLQTLPTEIQASCNEEVLVVCERRTVQVGALNKTPYFNPHFRITWCGRDFQCIST